jgi:hypothetical protein
VKGIVGGGLLGAEVVMITESLIGVRDGLWYAIGGGVGAAGGAVGGYFLGNSSSDGRAPMYLMAGGMALVIPTIVLVLNATRYKPSEDATEDKAPTGPEANPGKSGGSSVVGAEPSSPPAPTPAPPAPAAPSGGTTTAPTAPPGGSTTPPPPQSLLDLQVRERSTFRMGVPVPDVQMVYSLKEQKDLGVPNQAMVRMPVLHVVF